MPSVADRFVLRLERSMQGLAQLGAWVDQVAAALGLPRSQEYALRLCLEEAAANVVMHGVPVPGAACDAVMLEVRPLAGGLHVTVEDDCAAFDPLQQAAPDPNAGLEERSVGGLGIHLMREFTQALSYQRVDGVNRLAMTIGGGKAG